MPESLKPFNFIETIYSTNYPGVKINALIINNDVTNFALKEGAQNHTFTFSVTASVDADFGSVRGTNKLWDMLVYLSMNDQQGPTVSADASASGWQTQGT